MEDKLYYWLDVLKYTLMWLFGLGFVTVFIAPLYVYLLEEIGLFVYGIFVLLGITTKYLIDNSEKE